MEDRLIIAYDNCPLDVPVLMVARSSKCDMTILNEFQGDMATGVYHLLTGGAELMQKHGHWILRVENGVCDMTYQYECSKCKRPSRCKCATNFCPNCGIIMDEEIERA